MKAKNWRVRVEMTKYGVTNLDLAKHLGTNRFEISRLFRYELAESEQDKLIKSVHDVAGVK